MKGASNTENRKETYIAVSLFVVGSDGFEPPKA